MLLLWRQHPKDLLSMGILWAHHPTCWVCGGRGGLCFGAIFIIIVIVIVATLLLLLLLLVLLR